MNPSPILYTSPHSHSSHRHSPRPQANTHSPRLRPNKSSSGLDSSHVTFAQPPPPTVASSSAAGSQQQGPARSQYTEHGTQYSPPDWPPTDPRSSLRQAKTDHTIANAATSGASSNMVPVAVDMPSTRVSQMGTEVETKVGEGVGAAAATAAAATGVASPGIRRRHADMSHSPIRSTSSSSNSIVQDSRSKRARPATSHNINKTIMPRDYAECDSRVLSGLISGMLMELIHFNDEVSSNLEVVLLHPAHQSYSYRSTTTNSPASTPGDSIPYRQIEHDIMLIYLPEHLPTFLSMTTSFV